VAIAFTVCGALWLATTPAAMERLADESGFIESLTVVIYSIAITALMASFRRAPRLLIGSAFAVALLAARELDLHRLTSESAMALNSYGPGGMPLREQIVAGALVLALAVPAAAFVISHARPFLAALTAGRPAAWTVATVILLLAYSASIDGLQRKASRFFGVTLPPAETQHFLGAFEEGMELMIPLLILLALAQFLAEPRTGRADARG
jgi:hypothetical protein